MSLSQTQIIRSLAEALQWFEKELSWGAQIAELRHLTGRIGELYTAMITRGQMAMSVNQVGYDVVSAEGEKISVKTFTSSSRINFNNGTLHNAERVMILQIVLDENEPSIKEVLDCSVEELQPMLRNVNGDVYLPVNRMLKPSDKPTWLLEDLKEVAAAEWRGFRVSQLENGTIIVKEGGQVLPQGQNIGAPPLGSDQADCPVGPVDVLETQADDFAAPQAEIDQTPGHRIGSPARRKGFIERSQQFVDLSVGENLGQGRQSPVCRPRNAGSQFADPVAGHAAEPKIAADGAADHADGAGAAPILAENEAPDRAGADLRHRDRLVAEMGKQKRAGDPTALTAGVVRQAPDIPHVDVKARHLLRNGRFRGGIQRAHAIRPQHFQQLGKCGSQLVAQPPDRIGTIARRNMLRQEARDQGLADRAQAAPFPGQPMGEVRNAAQINTLGARGIPPPAQVRPKSRNVWLKNAVS